MIPAQTLVRVYKSNGAYQSDAAQLARQGWLPTSVTERRPRAGCARIVLLWWLTLLRPPKPELVVTYQRVQPQMPVAVYAATIPPGACPRCGHVNADGAFYCGNCRMQLRS